MRKWVAGLLLSISVILLTISLYFLMGFFVQERQDNQLQQELQELMQKKEDEPEEDASGDSLIEVDAGILALHALYSNIFHTNFIMKKNYHTVLLYYIMKINVQVDMKHPMNYAKNIENMFKSN